MSSEIKNNRFYEVYFASIIAGMVILILIQPKPFWLDECMLGYNVITKSYSELLQPLDMLQVAPIGYLFVVKFISSLFSYSDIGLLLPSITAVLLVYYLLFKTFDIYKKDVKYAILSIFLFKALLLYGFELKQYIFDALGITFYFYWEAIISSSTERPRFHFKHIVAVLVLMSFSNISLALMPFLFGYSLFEKSKFNIIKIGKKNLLALLTMFTFTFVYYLYFINGHPHTQNMQLYWTKHFFSFDGYSAAFISTHFIRFLDFHFISAPPKNVFFVLKFLSFLTMMVLFIPLLKKKKFFYIKFFLPFAAAFFMSFFRVYPFDAGRLTLYLAVPLLMLTGILLHEYLASKKSGLLFKLSFLLFSILFFYTFFEKIILHPKQNLKQVLTAWRTGDEFIVCGEAAKHFKFYEAQYQRQGRHFPSYQVKDSVSASNIRAIVYKAGSTVTVVGAHDSYLFGAYPTKESWCNFIKCYELKNKEVSFYFNKNKQLWVSVIRTVQQ